MDMATISFDRDITIKDKRAVRLIRAHLDAPVRPNEFSSVNVSEKLQRGMHALENFLRSNKLPRR